MSRSIFIIFIFILIFSPLAFGTVEPWSLTIMETAAFSAAFLLLYRNTKESNIPLYEAPGIIPLLFLLTYILIQCIPLPSEIVRVISPQTYDLFKTTVLIEEPGAWIPLSVNKKATLSEFFRIASYAAFYFLTVQLLSKKDYLLRTVNIIVIFASVLSIQGILQHFLSNGKLLWFRELAHGGTPFGPYVNRNHFAGLLGMIFPVILSLFIYYKPRTNHRNIRDKITELFSRQKTNVYLLLGFSVVLVALSVFLTLSRSGIISLCGSIIVFVLLLLGKGKRDKSSLLIIIMFLIIILSVSWFGWGIIIERFESARDIKYRIEIWEDSLRIIREFPLTGAGFGTFFYIFPAYQSFSGQRVGWKIIDHAHNDYVELLTEGGVLALLFCMLFLFMVFYKSWKRFLRRHETYSIYLFIGCISGMVSILIYSITDFNLHIGANGLYFFFFAGLAVSASHTCLRDAPNETYLKRLHLPTKIPAVLIAVFAITCFAYNSGIIIGKHIFSSIKDANLTDKMSPGDIEYIRDKSMKAAFFDPLEARYFYAVANTEKALSNDKTALAYYKKSVQRNPVNSEYLQRLGLLSNEFKRYDTAEQFLRSGIRYDVQNQVRYQRYALWLFSMGRRDEGIRITQQALSLDPNRTRDYITLMVLNRLSDEDILRALPERVEPHLLFADYLYRTGKDSMAEGEYLNALKYIKNENKITPAFFYSVYNYYMKKVLHGDALNIMRQAAEFLPGDAGIRITTGDLYEKLNLTHKAAEEYKQALVIDPKNEEARKRLSNILSKNKNQ